MPERRNQYHGKMQIGEHREAGNGSPCDAAIALTGSVSVDLGGVDKGGSQTGQYLIQGGFWGGYLDPGFDERRGMGLS